MRVTRVLRKHGVKRPRMVRREAKRANLALSNALAMLEKETGIPQRNVFGCDWGPQGGRPPYCGDKVTRRRVKKLIASGKANGIGWTQLTWPGFVQGAQRLGGAHKPRNQMRVGFRILKDNIVREGSIQQGFRAYNGSGPQAEQYGWDAVKIAAKWFVRLNP